MSEDLIREQAIDLRLLVTAARRRRGLLLSGLLLGASVGVVIGTLPPSPYISTSAVLLASSSPSSSQPVVLDPATFAEVAQSDPVVRRAVEATESNEGVRTLREAMTVSTPSASLVEITVADADPGIAVALATATASSFAGYIEEITSAPNTSNDGGLDAEISALRTQAERVDDELDRIRERQGSSAGAASSDAQLVGTLTAQRADLALKISELQQQRREAAAAEPTPTVSARVLHDGDEPVRSSPLNRALLTTLLGGLVGVCAATGIAIRLARLDTKTRSPEVVAGSVGAPIVAELASRASRTAKGWQELLDSYDPPPADLWAVRLWLRTMNLASEAHIPIEGHGKHRRFLGPSVTLTALQSDRKGQSLALVIPVAAATLGVRTTIIPRDETGEAVDLWAGMALARRGDGMRPRLTVAASTEAAGGDLVARIAVTRVDETDYDKYPATDAHLLCLSAGVASVDELSRLALAAYTSGRPITGVVLADPGAWERNRREWTTRDISDDKARASDEAIGSTASRGTENAL